MADPKIKPAPDEFDAPDEFEDEAAMSAPPPTAAAPPQFERGPTINDLSTRPPAIDYLDELANDSLRGANQGLTWLGSDELVAGANAAAGGPSFAQGADQERMLNAQAEERSPIAYPVARAAGFVPGMLVGPATALGRGVMAVGQGMLSGGLGSDSNDWGQTVVDALKGGAVNLGSQLGLTALGRGVSAVGNRIARGIPEPGATAAPRPEAPAPPPAAAPAPVQMSLPRIASGPEQLPLGGVSPAPPPAMPMAEPVPAPPPAAPIAQPKLSAPGIRQLADRAANDKELASQVMGTTARLGSVIAGGESARHGFDPIASAAGAAAGLGLSNDVGRMAQGMAPPMLRGVAKGVAGLGNTLYGAGEAMQGAGWMSPAIAAGIEGKPNPRIDDMAGPASPASATANGRGNLLPQAAMTALQHDPAALGKYQGQFAEAMVSKDPNAVGALISRLTQADPAFRQTVLPGLQRRTMGGDSQRSPSGY